MTKEPTFVARPTENRRRRSATRRSGFWLLAAGLVACGEDAAPTPDAGSVDGGDGLGDTCSYDTPCPLVPGERLVGTIGEVGDEDPYDFVVPAAGRVIEIVVANDANFSPVQLEAVLFEPGGQAVVNSRGPARGRQRVVIQTVATAAGTWRLVVRDVGSDSADRRNPYFVDLRLLDDPDANEPNDTPETATPIALGVPVSGTIGSQGDLDWFSVELRPGTLLEVRASAAEGLVRHRWSLFGPDATTRLVQSTEPPAGAPWPVEVRALRAQGGRYFVLVEDDPEGGLSADPAQPYRLELFERPEPDGNEGLEGNDVPERATPLVAGTPIQGFIASVADVDWYAIEVPAASPASPRLLTVDVAYPGASPVQLQMTVFEPDAETLVCQRRDGDACLGRRFVRDGSEGPSRLSTSHVVDAPGRYLVSVRDLQDDDFDGELAYTVTVRLPDEPDRLETYGPDSRSEATLVLPVTATTGATIEFDWVEGHLSYAGDTDWYRFDIPGPVDASEGQNGDWLVAVELRMPSPTPVELNAFFFGPEGSDRDRYRGVGQRCRTPRPEDPDFCQWPDEENGLDINFSTTLGSESGECFVVFREVTGAGPHYWRMSDLDRDDHDLGPTGRYRLRMIITAGCPEDSACMGRFRQGGMDLCGRP